MSKAVKDVVKESIAHDLKELTDDMKRFCEVYKHDDLVWQGDASEEEACYITADIDDFSDEVRNLELTVREAGYER